MTPPGTTILHVAISDELVPELVGKWIDCSRFRIVELDDGTCEIEVVE